MAMDQAMLEYASATQQVVLRIYEWSKPTISLGYFQSHDDRLNDPKLSSLDCVRRVTGGGAILHDRELTYSLAVPGNMQRKGHNEELYRAVHRAIVVWLQELGLQTNLWEDANRESAQPYLKEGSFWCFERRSEVDIVVDERKVVGSAQRRSSAGLLQHGSLLVETSIWTPQLPGILSQIPEKMVKAVNQQLTAIKLGKTIQNGLEHVLGCVWHDRGPDQVVCERAKTIDAERFSTLEWTRFKNRQVS